MKKSVHTIDKKHQLGGLAQLLAPFLVSFLLCFSWQPVVAGTSTEPPDTGVTRLEPAKLNGLYAAYFQSIAGDGRAMFMFHDGKIAGVDPGGVLYSGTYDIVADNAVSGIINVKVPPNIPLIFGMPSPSSGLDYQTDFQASIEKINSLHFRVSTPFGQVTVRLIKIGNL